MDKNLVNSGGGGGTFFYSWTGSFGPIDLGVIYLKQITNYSVTMFVMF